VTDAAAAETVERGVAGMGIKVLRGAAGLIELVRRDDNDIVLGAIVGSAGLPAMMAAVHAGKDLALANKESLVAAGSVLMPEARRRGVKILPVDSEHSAIFQAMACGRREQVREVILTASGGPFRGWERERIDRATVEDALNHPTWRMGKKITIDSATMFNKGLELIEACWLFDLPPEMVRIVIHPESIVHSMVEFVDGNVLAQLSPPDMKTPIQYALTYPDRVDGCGRRMNWAHAMTLHFSEPDYGKFPALGLARKVAQMGGTAGAVMNAANEAAVGAFLGGKIQFGEICRVVELTIGQHRVQGQPTLDDVLEADRWARTTAAGLAETLKISEIPSCP
jgi:1-deoxy-D-xylulose-5-phosphate reductoisomerase